MNPSRKYIKHLAYKYFANTNRGSYLFWLEYIKENLDEIRFHESNLKERGKDMIEAVLYEEHLLDEAASIAEYEAKYESAE